VRYYRLKIVGDDGTIQYSVIRPVVFDGETTWQIYPNPSNGAFNLIFQQNANETINVSVYDAKGVLVQQTKTLTTGFIQKITIDLRQGKYPPGMYMIEARGSATRIFKVVKQ